MITFGNIAIPYGTALTLNMTKLFLTMTLKRKRSKMIAFAFLNVAFALFAVVGD
tara:strand:+ start:696 stop:857 length:162 start_codon:yes stop_codon:yes gene_type:complete